MTTKTLQLILEEHRIHRAFWPEMKAIVFHHTRPCHDLLHRLHHVANYMAALDAILTELSKQVKFKFPPPFPQRKSRRIPA